MHATKVPKYRHQKVKGHDYAFVDLNGVRRYLGEYDSPESKNSYDRLIAEWLETGRSKIAAPALSTKPKEASVLELCGRFWEHVENYYRKPDGTATSEQDIFRQVIRTIKQLYAGLRVSEFGPRALKAVRQQFIERKICRDTANKYTSRVKSVFKWGVEQELVPPSVWHGLQAVAGLRRGRCEAPESEGVEPVQQTHVDAIQPFVSKQVWALIKLQLFTAARPGELVMLRSADIDKSGLIWVYTPKDHKTAHHGKKRCIYIGPKAQEIVAPFMVSRPIGDFLFSPVEAEKERHAEAESHRRPDQKQNACKTKRVIGDHYTTDSYRRCIDRACEKAGVPSWHPNQLRHNAATCVRKEFGLDVAQVILGHGSLSITEIYAELDREKAINAIAKSG